jgi:hypothetical protein
MRACPALLLALAVLAPVPALAQDAAVQIVITPADGSTTTPATTTPAATPSGGVYVPAGSAGSTGAYTPPGGTYVGTAPPHTEQRTNWAVLGAGIGMFAGGWVITWLSTILWYSFTTDCTSSGWWSYSCTHVGGPGGEGLAWSFVPVVGPWFMLSDPYLDTAGEVVFPILAGLVQDAGLVMFILGLVLKEDVLVGEEPMAAGDWRLNASASPGSFFGGLDVAF